MMSVIFGLVASALTVYPSGDPIFLLFMITLTLILMSLYASYRIGCRQGKKEMLVKMVEVIVAINVTNEVKLRLDAAFGDIEPLKIIQKEE